MDFNKALELKPNYNEVYFNLGNLYFRKERIAEALYNFNKAIELNPSYAEAYNNKENLLFSEKKFDEAIVMYSKARALKDNYGQAYYNRGLSNYYSGKKEAACTDLKQAVKLGESSAAYALNQICK